LDNSWEEDSPYSSDDMELAPVSTYFKYILPKFDINKQRD
jgi:hypothetical protein